MTLDEIRTKVSESDSEEWFNSLQLNLSYPHIRFVLNLTGIVAIYEFVVQQVAGWNKKAESLPDELAKSKRVFEDSQNKIIQLVNGNYRNYRENDWQEIKRELENDYRKYFPYNTPEVDFLLKVYRDFPDSFDSAFRFLTNNLPSNFSDKNVFIGCMLAYEFTLKDNSQILERRNAEKASIGKIRNDFMSYLTESENQINDYIQRTKNNYDEYTKRIDDLKDEKKVLVDEWFGNTKDSFYHFEQSSKEKVEQLEKSYDALLSLKKPADYWNKRAISLKKQGQDYLKWLVALVLFGCLTLYFLLWLTPEGMLLSFIKGQASAIKWSIVYVTFISLLAFGIRAVAKVMFSSFHLARDAEEREQLTYVYLAMIKESAIDEKDRSLIMQSLFSRSDTGLLKEDSTPAMPGLTEKIINRS